MRGPCKMVLLLRTDLEMGKGKAAAQCCHATLAAYRAIMRDQKSQGYLKQWEREGETKIVLKVGGGEEEIRSLVAKARKSGLVAEYIKDAGHTQVAPGTITVAAVGPGPAALIDSVTGYLKLC